MNWLREHKQMVNRILTGILFTGVILFLGTGIRLYRQKKIIEADIAARRAATESQDRIENEASDTDKAASEPAAGKTENLFPLVMEEEVTWQGTHYKKNSYVKVILCMGIDRSGSLQEKTTTGFGGQADGIFLIAQDTSRNTWKILMIPRDTMTPITLTDLSGNVLGKDIQHLTLAYAYGDGREKSCEYMTEAVSELLGGLHIDWYLAADMDVISVLNDVVGGVTVNILEDGLETRDPALVKGTVVTLQDRQAEIFVRYRDIQEDHSALYRMDRHEQYLEGFFRTLQQAARQNSNVIPELFEKIQENMITNMSKDQYLKIALDAVNGEPLLESSIYTVPGQGITTNLYDEFYANPEELIPVLLNMFYRES
ncbi:MAG: LCP family protein [Lachnospiraceae bacterium]